LPSLKEILDVLRAEPNLERAARRLGVKPERLRLYAAGLAANGLARPLAPARNCDCSKCPLRSLC